LKKSPSVLLLFVLCPLVFAQGNFSGPGILSTGTGGVGQRSGQDVNLRFLGNATGVYDTGLTPYAITKERTLVQPEGLYGVEVGLGGYGRHTFRRSQLGLDYSGNFRHYPSASTYDGSNQQLRLEYIVEKSRRLRFDFNQSAGTQNFGTALGSSFGGGDVIVDSSSILFDNRTSYLQSSMTTRYAMTGRTTLSMGGSYYTVHRSASALVGVNGYTLQGSIEHQTSRTNKIGVAYQHTHYDFPRAFGETDINMYMGTWSSSFGRSWTLGLSAGVFTAAVQGVQSTALDPDIAALLGIGNLQTIFYRENIIPTGQINLMKRFRRANWNAQYNRTVTPGNGVFLTSRQETYGSGFSYTGLRRWSFSASGNVAKLSSLGLDLQPFSQISGSASISYNLGAGFNLTAGYLRRHQDLAISTFRKDSSRTSIGIVFSPGELPISFH